MTLEYVTAKDRLSNGHNPLAVMEVKDVDSIEHMPIKAKPYSHQIIGYNLACRILLITKGGD